MDIITYALLKNQLDNVTLAYSYKGSVADVESLPGDANIGDLYTVGSDQYVYDGNIYILIGGAITEAQIDALMED